MSVAQIKPWYMVQSSNDQESAKRAAIKQVSKSVGCVWDAII